MKHILLLAVLAFGIVANAQSEYEIAVESRKPSGIIDEILYGQLFEHVLTRCRVEQYHLIRLLGDFIRYEECLV